MYRWTMALGAGLLVLVALSGWGRAAGVGPTQDAGAARAVRSLTAGTTSAATLPADFPTRMGYRPVVEQGVLLRPDGGCSSPFGDTRWGFGIACKRHDLGYDLLRYAQRRHAPLGPWARHAVDSQFLATMRARCPSTACRWAADGYWAVVAVNSWRQGYGTPVVEHLAELLPGAAGGALTAGALLFLPGRLRRSSPGTPARRGHPVGAR